MNTTLPGSDDDVRLMQATEWLLRLKVPEVDEQVAAQWLEWCQSDPDNLAAFERVRALWNTFDDKRLAEPLARDVAQSSLGSATKVDDRSRRPRLRHLAVAATLLLAVGAATWFALDAGLDAPYVSVLRTDVASLRSQSLPDGSRIELGARSIARVNFTQEQRTVAIEEGEAFFDVAKDPDRPFVVRAGALQVVAVGTAFNVRMSGARVVVSVEEGVVRIASRDPVPTAVNGGASIELPSESAEGQIRAGAGVRVTYTADEHALTMVKVPPAAAVAWRSGRLEFVNEPLVAVVADLNRYSQRPIKLEGERLSALMYTGTVRSDAIDDWLGAVEQVFAVSVVDRGAKGIVIEDRAQR